jgi:hypothetical protein
VIREYADRAITGADSSRPQYREMLSEADRREFDILLVDDLNRLARDQVESASSGTSNFKAYASWRQQTVTTRRRRPPRGGFSAR